MKLSILLATYNGEEYLSAQLESLIDQSYSDFTVYISDDCSTDGTSQVIENFVSRYPQKIIDLKNSEHFGSAKKNFLNLVEKVDSDIYMFCDQDDVWLPNKIELTLNEYKKTANENVPVLIHTDLKVVDGNLQIIDDSLFNYMQMVKNVADWRNFAVQNTVTGCTMLINRTLADLYKKNKNLVNLDNILMHDYFFALLASVCGKIVFIEEPTMLYRQHGKNSVGAKNVCSINYALQKLRSAKVTDSEVVGCLLQAGEVAKILKLYNQECAGEKSAKVLEAAQILEDYSKIKELSKLKRIRFINKNKLLKKGAKRRLFQLFTI